MATNTDIPQGYKATALGIIPQEWKTIRLKDCFSISAGGDVQKDCFSEAPSLQYKYPIYSNSLFNHGLYGFTSHPRHKANSITITGRGALGHAEYREIDFDAIVRLLVLAPKIPLNGQYITEYINFRKPFFYESTGVPQLTAPQIANIQVLFPPLGEQRKIAEVLGVWDEAIEKQARLIEKLALRKRALMQRLLSAKLRLPGFSEPWEKVKLGDIGHFLSSNTLSRDCLNEQIGNIKNIHYGDILIKLPTIVDASFIHIPYVNDDVIVKSDYLKNGDIIFADTAEDYTVGKAIEIINIQAIPVTSGLHTIPFRPKSGIFVNRFLGYYVNSTDYRRQLQPLIQGIKVYSISKTALCKTTLKIPTLSEQTAIAEVLTAADREIELAKEKLERLRRQKRGLMQQLLSGKKRVKINI